MGPKIEKFQKFSFFTFTACLGFCVSIGMSAIADAGKCKNSKALDSEQLSSIADLNSFLGKSNFASIDEFICCLPTEYRTDYIVGNSSIAAQNGTPDSPRIIMSSLSHNGGKKSIPKFMMSANGGNGHNSQGKSIELAFFNPDTKELEFYDVSFKSRRVKVSDKNPSLCMTCHGEMGPGPKGIVPPGGPKYIFDAFGNWQRFVGGISNCNPEADKLHLVLGDHSIRAIANDHRFNCLDKSILEIAKDKTNPSERYPKLSENLGKFDNRNLTQNHFRMSLRLKKYPEFERYKFFLLGFSYCESNQLSDWFPPTKVQEILSKLSFDKRLFKSNDLNIDFQKAVKEEWEKNLEKRHSELELAQHPERAFSFGFPPNYSSMACQKTFSEDIAPHLKFSGGELNHNNLKLLQSLDQVLNAGPAGSNFPELPLRVFLDTEGYRVAQISTVMTEFEQKKIRGNPKIELSLEEPDSKLTALFEKVSRDDFLKKSLAEQLGDHAQMDFDLSMYLPKGGYLHVCNELKRLSMEQFATPAGDAMSSKAR